MIFDLGNGRQIIVSNGRLMLWANRGCLGVEMTIEQQAEIGLAMFHAARRAQRSTGEPK